MAYVKGAPDMLLLRCSHVSINGKISKLTNAQKKKILKENDNMTKSALRVLAFAYKPLSKTFNLKSKSAINPKNIESKLIFVGLQAMLDPPREEVKQVIEKCDTAGIKTVVITGDHKLTATAIAKKLNIFKKGDIGITGTELDKLSQKDFTKVVNKITIYARATPAHKARILSALQKKGNIVAMTGDGVNDAPALKKSDIGIAMGITGTDVAKESSDLILTDDNFSSIVNAIEEGRGIYNNIKRFVEYLLSCNAGEVFVVALAIIIGWPLPLIAIQILLMNLITDGFPALALGLDRHEKDLMLQKPRKKSEQIISKQVVHNIILTGLIMTFGTLFLFWHYGVDTLKAKSVAFTTLIMFQLFNVLTYKSKDFKINLKESKYLLAAVLTSILVQIAILYSPLNTIFKIVPLGPYDWIKIILVSASLYVIINIKNMLKKK